MLLIHITVSLLYDCIFFLFLINKASFVSKFSFFLLLSLVASIERKMAEFLTFAAQGILTRVALLAEQKFSLLWGFKGEVQMLRDSLSLIQAMLRDAEQRQDRAPEVLKTG